MRKWLTTAMVLMTTSLWAAFPTDDAVALWHLENTNDINGANSVLQAFGDVRLGVALSDAEAAESTLRGGDGKVAQFKRGAYLLAGQGADGELSIGKSNLTIYLRVRLPENVKNCPIFSKRGKNVAYNIFAYHDYFGVEVGTTRNKSTLTGCALFDEMRNPETSRTAWHDVVCRVNEAKLEFFVDGRCVDEDFVVGELRTNDIPVILGGQIGDGPNVDARFEGELDTVAVWNRAISNEEIVILSGGKEKADLRSRLDNGREKKMQYWTPPNGYFVGDTFPFSHEGVFHAGFLLDKRHHGSKNGYGAHQWIQATSTDLVHWEFQPFIVPIEYQMEGSICTGSMFFHDGKYYAFYGNRWTLPVPEGAMELPREGLISWSESEDGIHFKKSMKPLFPTPAGYGSGTRDPVVFQNPKDKKFHLYATDSHRGKGCWLHMVSADLKEWTLADPVFTDHEGQPECPDWFEWGGTYYVIAGHGNGFWRYSKNADGPWDIPAGPNVIMPGSTRVPKTAPWRDGRRIVTGFLGLGGWGGTIVFHELVRRDDGTLGEKFVPEMIPETGEAVVSETNLTGEKTWSDLPANGRIQVEMKFDPQKRDALPDREIRLGENQSIVVSPTRRCVQVGRVKIEKMDFSTGTVVLDVIFKDNVLDVCVNNDRTATLLIEKAEARTIGWFGDAASFSICPLK